MLLSRQASSAAAGPSSQTNWGLCAGGRISCSRPVRSRRTAARSTVSEFDNETQRVPPPPPPPPPPPSQTRRGVLQYAGLVGAAVAGGALGFLAGGNANQGGSAMPAGATITGAERKEIDELRAEAQFRREYDGHVWVQARSGDWWEVRLDAQIPGTLLLRDPDGYVNFITLNLQQIDLTDDYVVVALFGDGSWEQQVKRIQVRNDADRIVDAKLSQEAFRDLISVMT